MKKLPCIVCGKKLENQDKRWVQPNHGVSVETTGNYGSRVLDSCADTNYEPSVYFVVCDLCMLEAGLRGRLWTATDESGPHPFVFGPRTQAWAESPQDSERETYFRERGLRW